MAAFFHKYVSSYNQLSLEVNADLELERLTKYIL